MRPIERSSVTGVYLGKQYTVLAIPKVCHTPPLLIPPEPHSCHMVVGTLNPRMLVGTCLTPCLAPCLGFSVPTKMLQFKVPTTMREHGVRGGETGSETGSKTGGETGSETASKTGGETGSETGSETGARQGARQGARRAPSETFTS